MVKNTLNSLENQLLFGCILNIQDPRVKGRCLYPLQVILTITLLALISGAHSWKAIALFATERKRWLSQFVDLSNGVPSHYTFGRVVGLIDPEGFKKALIHWASLTCHLVKDDIINIDGKTLRGSGHKSTEKKALHIVNAYAARQEITLGEVKTPDKSNEIKAIPILLNSLNIGDTIITLDAMGTQKGIANLIRKKQAHYVLALKENHKRFYKKVNNLFEKADELDYSGMVYQQFSDRVPGHNRIEEREYTILPMMYLHGYKKNWRDLSIFVRVKTKRHLDNSVEEGTRYYISSIPFGNYHKAMQAIRQHWSIENKLHWKLDVTLGEDQCQIYAAHAAENLATFRKFVLYLLQSEKTLEAGIKLKQQKAAMNCKYLRKVAQF